MFPEKKGGGNQTTYNLQSDWSAHIFWGKEMGEPFHTISS